jgi:hypothetical protein
MGQWSDSDCLIFSKYVFLCPVCGGQNPFFTSKIIVYAIIYLAIMSLRNSKFIAFFGIAIFIVFLFVTLFGLSLSANSSHIDCYPVGSHCATPIQHVDNWYSAFTATVLNLFVLGFILFVLSLIKYIRPAYSIVVKSLVVFLETKSFVNNPIQIALASGTLQPTL